MSKIKNPYLTIKKIGVIDEDLISTSTNFKKYVFCYGEVSPLIRKFRMSQKKLLNQPQHSDLLI